MFNLQATGDEGKKPSGRGFAGMDREKRRAIASKGGRASHGGGRKPKSQREE